MDDSSQGGILTRRCVSCGNLAKDDARFCNVCGASLLESHAPEQQIASAGISPEDAHEIIEEVRRAYSSIPIIARPMVPPMPEVLRRIPACARKYTLQQLIDLLDEAYSQGFLS